MTLSYPSLRIEDGGVGDDEDGGGGDDEDGGDGDDEQDGGEGRKWGAPADLDFPTSSSSSTAPTTCSSLLLQSNVLLHHLKVLSTAVQRKWGPQSCAEQK